MASRRVRIGLGVVGGVVGLCVLAAVLLPLLVPREKLRDLAETRVRATTGGQVSLGKISLRVFPRLSLVLGASTLAVTGDGLRGAGQDPGPLRSAEISLERLEVDLALWPLLRKELDFGEVGLITPRVDLVTVAPAVPSAGEAGAAGPAVGPPAPTPALGLTLASVSVRDGDLYWRRKAAAARSRFTAGNRISRRPTSASSSRGCSGSAARIYRPTLWRGRRTLELDTRIAAIELGGFGETPPPPLKELHLHATLSVPAAADRADLTIRELSLPDWTVAAHGSLTATRVDLDHLELRGGQAVNMTGTASFSTPPATGPLRADLSGSVDLASILAVVEPWLPPRPAEQPPLPSFTGSLTVGVSVDLTDPPSLAAAAAWTAARAKGLAGRAELQASGGPLTVTTSQLGEPLQIEHVQVTSDLRSLAGKTRIAASGVAVSAGRLDATLELVAPPASGPLQADVTGRVDLAKLMALVGPLLPPRPADAAPLPGLDGELDVTLAAALGTVPSLADTAAWRAAWREGLPGRADLKVSGGPVTVTVPELGDPLRMKTVTLTSDLRSPSGKSRLQVTGISHPVLRGDAVAEVVPAGKDGAVQVQLTLDRLDLDALAVVAQQATRPAASGAQTRAGFLLVGTAWAEPTAAPLPGELIPPDLKADLSATAQTLVFLKSDYTDVKLQGTLRERVIDVPSLSAHLGDGTITGKARVDYAADPGGRATGRPGQGGAGRTPAQAVRAVPGRRLDRRARRASDRRLPARRPGRGPQLPDARRRRDGDQRRDRPAPATRRRQQVPGQAAGPPARAVRVGPQALHGPGRQGPPDNLRIDGKDTDWTGAGGSDSTASWT